MTISERVKRVQDEISNVASLYDITSWERQFMESVKNRWRLSPKQEAILARIERKVFAQDLR